MSGTIEDMGIFGVVDPRELSGRLLVCTISRFPERQPRWILPNGVLATDDRPRWKEVQQIIAITVVGATNPVIRRNVGYDRRLSKCRVTAKPYSGCVAVLRRNKYLRARQETDTMRPEYRRNVTSRPPWRDDARILCYDGHPNRLGVKICFAYRRTVNYAPALRSDDLVQS